MAAATAAHPAPMGLSFPAQTFQKLSPTAYLQRHLQSARGPTRPSARAPEDFRPATLHTRSLSHAHGSAVIRTGDTAVVCGVRGEILSLVNGEGRGKGKTVLERSGETRAEDEEIVTHSLLVPNLELGTGCSRDYHPGPPSDFAQSLAERLRSLLIDTTRLVPASTLRITDDADDIKAYWVLYIDVVCISLDGNVLDTAWASIVAALHSTRLPFAAWDADSSGVVCDPNPALYRPLEIRALAFTASFCVYSAVVDEEVKEEGKEGEAGRQGREVTWVLSDPDEFEEAACEERVLVCVRADGKVAKIEKGGGLSPAGMDTVGVCVGRARERYREWEKLVLGDASR